MDIDVIAIIAVSGFVATMIIGTCGGLCVAFVKVWRSGGSKRTAKTDAEETRLIQELHHGLSKMMDRVETLETLLFEDEQRKKSDFDERLRQG